MSYSAVQRVHAHVITFRMRTLTDVASMFCVDARRFVHNCPDDAGLMDCFPQSLRKSIAVHNKLSVVRAVPLFGNASQVSDKHMWL